MSKHIILKNVRLSFPNLFQKEVFEGKEGKYAATFILDPVANKADIEAIKGICKEAAAEKLDGKMPTPDKIALKSDQFNGGESGERPEYAGCYTFKATNKNQPAIVDEARNPILESANKMYSGCYVNVKVSVWAMNNQYGKRICGELVAVQFAKDGENLDTSFISPEAAVEGFEEGVAMDEPDW